MTSSTPALIELITKTIGSPVPDGNGGFATVPDNDMVVYRLMDIPSNNYAAYLKEAKEFLNTAVQMIGKVRTVSYERIVAEISAIERYYQISITGKASEQGKFIKELLKDETMQRHVFKQEGRKGFMQRMSGAQGEEEGGPPPVA